MRSKSAEKKGIVNRAKDRWPEVVLAGALAVFGSCGDHESASVEISEDGCSVTVTAQRGMKVSIGSGKGESDGRGMGGSSGYSIEKNGTETLATGSHNKDEGIRVVLLDQSEELVAWDSATVTRDC